MVVDEFSEDNNGTSFELDISKDSLRQIILQSISNTARPFTIAVQNHENQDWNEDSLTQVFIGQNTVQLQKTGLPLMVAVQYRDIYHKTKGIPDVFYSLIEEGKDHKPEFLMEAKRLPAPTLKREKEYVVGTTPSGNPNGGIERFKLGRHGAGHPHCGMLAFVEDSEFEDWFNSVNRWISELIPSWSKNELLELQEVKPFCNHYKSKAEREDNELHIDHFWIKIFNN
ncbi:hypothetical protein [Christiangramia forsetii]|uniref:Uncharacterized protein n=2 Tax=Christiangramia forsetii TaxID=411153 RepID=A0M149_CHRFK|nr:hypothetical protein [Christiangramia forsetii]GGG46221.1 hypothetical protein GCM10011532_32650 [Christiangramia forsetii]CAL66344.1 hypothetical protein GFO_1370 [Christiangramia forsetii KT0803]